MRKIYYLFLTMLFGMVGMTANAEDITVTVNVDDASRLKVYWEETDYSSSPYQTTKHYAEAVDNVFTVTMPQYNSLYFECNEGYLLNTVSVDSYGNAKYKSSYSNYFYSTSSVDVTTFVETDIRTGAVSINMDDFNAVSIRVLGSGKTLELTENAYTYKYIPNYETGLEIGPKGSKPLYEVKYNDVVQSAPYGYYSISFDASAESHIIDIQANAPAGTKQTVIISYENPTKADGFITSVTVDGVAIDAEQYLAKDGFSVDWGSKVAIAGDVDNFKVNSFSVNDESSTNGSVIFNATEDKTVVIDAERYQKYSATINIADPASVTVQNMIQSGYQYSYKDIILENSGDNTISVSEKNPTITIKSNDGFYIKSITKDDVAQTANHDGSYNVTLTDGCTVLIDAAAIVRDKTLTVNIDNKSGLSYFSFTGGGKEVSLETGKNLVPFCDADLPIQLNTSSYTSSYFLNKIKIGSVYLTSLNDGDVLDLYFASTPATYTISFTVDNVFNMNNTLPTLTTSLGTPDYWQYQGITLLEDAEIELCLTPKEDAPINVKVGGTYVQANTEGNYVFTVNNATAVEILDRTTDGINSINAAANDGKIYNLQGVEVKKMSRGMYIKNGKKVVVK